MIKLFPMEALGKALKQRNEFIEIDDFAMYKRCRVQSHAQGVVERDIVSGTEVKTKRQQVCRAHEFLVAEIDAKVGGFGIIPDSLEGAIVSSHYFLFTIDESILDRRFLDYYIRTPSFLGQVRAQGTTNYAAIRPNDVLNYKIPLPPLDEQRRIVARIEELAAKIEEARKLRREAVEETEVLLRSALESLFDIKRPKKWPLKKLTDNGFATVVAGQHIMVEDYDLSGEGFPYITGPADFGPKVPTIGKWTSNPKSTALPGDVLLTVKGAGVGKVNLAPEMEVAIGRQIMAIRPNKEYLLTDFAYYFLVHKSTYFQSIATATTVPGFKKNNIEDVFIPFPTLSEQRRIVAHLDALQAQIDRLKREQAEAAAELDKLLPSILDKAFKGEL